MPSTSTPRGRRGQNSTEDTIVVNTTPSQDADDSQTPNTRKRARLNYNTLHNHGFNGSPPPSPSVNTTAKKAQVTAAKKASQASQQSTFTVPEEEDEEIEEQEPERSGGGKRAWWWEYFTVEVLTTTFEKGRGKKKVTTPDEKYICKLCKNAKPFVRLASKLNGAASAMKDHIEGKHHKYEKTEENAGQSRQPTGLQKYLKPAEETPPSVLGRSDLDLI
jgi:hypothetical protein